MEVLYYIVLGLLFNCVVLSEVNNEEIIEDYIHMQTSSEHQTKIMSCLSIIHNSLGEGNEDLKRVFSKQKEGLDKLFDKYVIAMLNKCINTITKEHINTILSPEKIYGKLTIEDKNLIKISPGMVSDTSNLTSEEQQLFQTIEEALKIDYSKNRITSSPSFFDNNLYWISICACGVLVVLILLTLRSIFNDQKIIKKHKDE